MKNKTIVRYIWSKNSGTKKSTSAGAFYLIANRFFERYKDKTVIYGCALIGNNVAKHIRVTQKKNIELLQGSKYVQSDTREIYNQLLSDLQNGKYVLFSGTSCQSEAARKVAGKYSERLYIIDVLCHGVPSPKLWKDYIEYLEKKHGAAISKVSFRNKSKSNRMGYILNYCVKGKYINEFPDESAYYNAFIKGYSLRPSCYICPFISDKSSSDLTLADSNYKGFHPTEAISLILIKSKKGLELVESIRQDCEIKKANLSEDIFSNRKLVEPTKRPKERDNYYFSYYDSFNKKVSYKKKIINRIKNIIPTGIKEKLRR